MKLKLNNIDYGELIVTILTLLLLIALLLDVDCFISMYGDYRVIARIITLSFAIGFSSSAILFKRVVETVLMEGNGNA